MRTMKNLATAIVMGFALCGMFLVPVQGIASEERIISPGNVQGDPEDGLGSGGAGGDQTDFHNEPNTGLFGDPRDGIDFHTGDPGDGMDFARDLEESGDFIIELGVIVFFRCNWIP